MLKQLEQSLRELHFSESYIKENIANAEKWEKIGLLKDIEDTYVWRQLSRLFENQKFFNEKDDLSIRWKRIAIPCIRRIFSDLLPYKLVSIQALSKTEDVCNFINLEGRQNAQIIQTRVRRLIPYEFPSLTENDKLNFDQEMQFVGHFSDHYCKEITQEILNDLIHVASSKADAKYKDEKELLAFVEGMSAYISSKLRGREATWLVANSEIANILRTVTEKWQIYEWDLEDKILMGYKDNKNHYLSGYCYCPYKPIIVSEDQQIFSRYGKTLINADFFGVINLMKGDNGI